MKKVQESSKKYECKECNYITIRKSQFDRHILTAKHQNRTFRTEKVPKSSEIIFRCVCGKEYNARNSLWYHKKNCTYEPHSQKETKKETKNEEPSREIQNMIENTNENNIDYKDMFLEMMKQNQELQKAVVQQQDTIKEIIPKIGNNNTTNTTNNNQFNLQMFLNEDCKNAQNITDFMKSIQVNMNDLIQTGKLGYVEGMSRIFVKALNDMDVTERPIHCTDIKRETVYIKDQDKWAKDEDDKIKIKKTIQNIENKNIRMLPKWQDENPDCMDMESKKSEELTDLSIIVLGGHEEREKSEKKIMKNVLKEVILDKK